MINHLKKFRINFKNKFNNVYVSRAYTNNAISIKVHKPSIYFAKYLYLSLIPLLFLENSSCDKNDQEVKKYLSRSFVGLNFTLTLYKLSVYPFKLNL